MQTIKVNGKLYECKIHTITDGALYTMFELGIGIDEALTTFTDDTSIVLVDDGVETEMVECRLLKEITYRSTENTVVVYRELTDLEKLIELHYGGVN